ncbi:hypothetical protein PR048_017915 [Dryococelus australis]|uniref:Uncharacterized protein n=1 Tax=Dryococelus australis TaxID=614101 RepID=A0ABQ9HAY8_9NEOP|nr:hypothetical protein PR048_017915 [Dryococelus australis]
MYKIEDKTSYAGFTMPRRGIPDSQTRCYNPNISTTIISSKFTIPRQIPPAKSCAAFGKTLKWPTVSVTDRSSLNCETASTARRTATHRCIAEPALQGLEKSIGTTTCTPVHNLAHRGDGTLYARFQRIAYRTREFLHSLKREKSTLLKWEASSMSWVHHDTRNGRELATVLGKVGKALSWTCLGCWRRHWSLVSDTRARSQRGEQVPPPSVDQFVPSDDAHVCKTDHSLQSTQFPKTNKLKLRNISHIRAASLRTPVGKWRNEPFFKACVPRYSLVSGRNTFSFPRLHGSYWLLLRAPRMYRSEQTPAYLATLHHTPLPEMDIGYLLQTEVVLSPCLPTHEDNAPPGRGGVVVRLLASHLGELSSTPGRAAPEFSHVGIVPDDAASQRCASLSARRLVSTIAWKEKQLSAGKSRLVTEHLAYALYGVFTGGCTECPRVAANKQRLCAVVRSAIGPASGVLVILKVVRKHTEHARSWFTLFSIAVALLPYGRM